MLYTSYIFTLYTVECEKEKVWYGGHTVTTIMIFSLGENMDKCFSINLKLIIQCY